MERSTNKFKASAHVFHGYGLVFGRELADPVEDIVIVSGVLLEFEAEAASPVSKEEPDRLVPRLAKGKHLWSSIK